MNDNRNGLDDQNVNMVSTESSQSGFVGPTQSTGSITSAANDGGNITGEQIPDGALSINETVAQPEEQPVSPDGNSGAMSEGQSVAPDSESTARENLGGPIYPGSPITSGDPVQPAPASTPIINTSNNNKKKPVGIIVAVILLFLCGGGLFAASFISHLPTQLASSVISSLLNNPGISISGTLTNKPLGDDSSNEGDTYNEVEYYNYTPQDTRLDINYGLDKDYQMSLSVKLLNDSSSNNPSDTGFEALLTRDRSIYLKTNGVDEMLGFVSQSSLETPTDDSSTDSTAKLDGEWLEIKVPEIIDALTFVSEDNKSEYKKIYECVSGKAEDTLRTLTKSVSEGYKKNQFVRLEKYKGDRTFTTKGKPYVVSLQARELSAFVLDIIESGDLNNFSVLSCRDYDEEIKKEFDALEEQNINDLKEFLNNQEDFENYLRESFPEVVVTVNHKLFGGELSGAFLSSSDREADLTLEKHNNVFEAPVDAKNLTELLSNLLNGLFETTIGYSSSDSDYANSSIYDEYNYEQSDLPSYDSGDDMYEYSD